MITGEQLKAIQNHNQIAIRKDDGEWEILGNINTFEMSCECGESPTINIEISQNHIYTMPNPNYATEIVFPEIPDITQCYYNPDVTIDLNLDGIDAMRYCVEDIKNTKKLEEKEGKDMKLLNMYVEKSEKNIKEYYEKLLDEEYEDRGVVKEFKALCDKFQEDLAKLAEKTANDECKLVEIDCEYFESGYGIECNPTEEEQEIREKLSEEVRNLHDKIDEVNAQLEIVTSDENSSHHDINYVLYNYGIVDDANKLTPYTPTFVGKEAPKKAGRPKKVSE